jgi:superfamily II DNA or RNA helicase
MYEIDSVLRIKDEFIPQCEYDRLISKIDGKDYPLYDVREKEIIFPRGKGISYLKRYGVTYCDHRTHGRAIPQDSNFIPRHNQEEVIQAFLNKLPLFDGGILCSGCGSGKTVMSAQLAIRIGRSTLVCIHKEFLKDQWIAAFNMLNPNLKIGVCQGDVCNTGVEYDVVIAFIQSLLAREYPVEFYNSFGTTINDEVHRFGAEKWKQVFERIPAYHRIGITATPHRRDGFWDLITAHIGPILFTNSGDHLHPRIFGVRMNTYLNPWQYGAKWASPDQQNAKILSLLAKDEGRNKHLAKYTIDAYKKGRKVMFASARIQHLKDIYNLCLVEIPAEDMSLYVGGMKKDKLLEAKEKQIIFTSFQLTSEGFDQPDLDLLILGLPRTSILQTVGRILREAENKSSPVVIDPIDHLVPSLNRSWENRRKQYIERNYEIVE